MKPFKEIEKAIGRIECGEEDQDDQDNHCTGFLIDPLYILTARHGIQNYLDDSNHKIKITFVNLENSPSFLLELLGEEENYDLALLKLPQEITEMYRFSSQWD